MSYLNFLLVFLIPPLTLGAFYFYKSKSSEKKFALIGMTVLASLAMLYTTPWDNFLVANDVWWYGKDRVLGTIGYVPIEEYCFFILQTYMTGFWTYFLWLKSKKNKVKTKRKLFKALKLTSIFVVEVISLYMLKFDSTFYMGLILSWSMPVIFIQLAFGFDHVLANLKTFYLAFFIPSVYLCFADAFAIKNGIWEISKKFTLGINLGVLPVEEATFFFMTNIMVAQGLLLFLYMKKSLKKAQKVV